MVLYNADGSRAEMSGNGIRCFAQAAGHAPRRPRPTQCDPHRRRPAPRRAAADRGPDDDPRHRRHGRGRRPRRARRLGRASAPTPTAPSPTSASATRTPSSASTTSRAVDLLALGRQVPHVNLEIVEPGPGADADHDARPRARRRHHRGLRHRAPRAAAWAAAALGPRRPPASRNCVVHMDGGSARVALHRPEPGRVTLTGPATYVATIEVPYAA